LQVSCTSADDTHFLSGGEKICCDHMSGVAACSENYIHRHLHIRELDAAGWGWASTRKDIAGVVRADWLTRQSGKVGDPSLRLKNGYAQDDAGV